MRTLLAIARFECARRARMLSTLVYFAVFFALGFLMMIAAGGAFQSVSVGMGADKVDANAPFALNGLITILSHFAVLVTAAVFGQAVHQDFETRSFPLFFTTPISTRAYLGGRFLGALAFMSLVLGSIALGLAFGTCMPFVESEAFGPFRFSAYVAPYLVTVLPNLILTGALFFSLAVLARRMLPVYVGAVVLLIGYLMAVNLTRKIENKFIGGLVDPFGITASHLVTEYWTVAEKNARLVPLEGVLLVNRLLWVGAALALLSFVFLRFKFSWGELRSRDPKVAAEPATPIGPLPVARPEPGGVAGLLARQCWLNFTETVKNVYFLVIVIAGMLFMVVTALQAGALYGTTTWPVTYQVLEITGGTFALFIIILITFYSGELVWRERDAGMDPLLDVLPIPTWVPFVAKLVALLAMQVVLLMLVMVVGLVLQTVKGYYHYELSLYLGDLAITFVNFALLGVLAMTVQTVVQHKYVGHFLIILYYLSTLFMGRLGLEHNLYRFGENPGYQYSDMNGYGHFLRPVFWFDLYWGAFTVLLAVASSVLWARGLDRGLRVRLALARARFTRPLQILTAVVAVVFVVTGGFIFWNTNVLNRYETSRHGESETARYEKTWKKIEKEPQPRVTDVKVAFAIRPEDPSVRASGTYTLTNKTSSEIRTVWINLPSYLEFETLSVGTTAAPTESDVALGVYTFALAEPLAPGATVPLKFAIDFRPKGFENGRSSSMVVENGVFLNSGALPSIGYVAGNELSEDNSRKKYGLPPKERMADVADLEARRNTYIGSDADWITFEAEVSTAPDQIAVAPGYLEREWLEGGRRHFSYKMDSRILSFFSVLSARYAVKKDVWEHDGKAVALEIYYHPGHEYDLDRMMSGMKDALSYCTTSFGPYQHRQLRILEFPRYATFAQAFPNTIPYSESIGFIARVDPEDPQDVDFPYYVTAHETAHQWWAHQVIGGNVQGSTMLSETMAQYSALMVMKKKYGENRMRRYLSYELDNYLQGRAMERKKELPLERVENQPYIHYNKGSLVMYALQDYLGEEVLNRAIAGYVAKVKFQEPPFTNSLELVEEIRAVTPPDLQYLIADLFETITLYDNRTLTATSKPVEGGRVEVTLAVRTKKLRAAELGAETEAPMDDLIEIGAVDEKGEPLHLEKRRLGSGDSTITFTVDAMPAKAGIDPLHKLIDRKPDDNLVRVVETSGGT